jgi:hypothetical protein
MLDNNMYNLMAQITEESQSLWRIKNSYKKDSGGCKECMDFWIKLEKDKEEHIKQLEKLISVHTEAMSTARR